jgi:hypothetical protein
MQPQENAFDRVKSLLGKMDRSIDEARRRRLREDEGEDARQEEAGAQGSDNPGSPDKAPDAAQPDEHPDKTTPPARPASKYGRATPLRDLANRNTPSWRQT